MSDANILFAIALIIGPIIGYLAVKYHWKIADIL